jgi:hypothetical protein
LVAVALTEIVIHLVEAALAAVALAEIFLTHLLTAVAAREE